MTADPLAQSICADMNLSGEAAKDLSSSVASIKVFAIKARRSGQNESY